MNKELLKNKLSEVKFEVSNKDWALTNSALKKKLFWKFSASSLNIYTSCAGLIAGGLFSYAVLKATSSNTQKTKNQKLTTINNSTDSLNKKFLENTQENSIADTNNTNYSANTNETKETNNETNLSENNNSNNLHPAVTFGQPIEATNIDNKTSSAVIKPEKQPSSLIENTTLNVIAEKPTTIVKDIVSEKKNTIDYQKPEEIDPTITTNTTAEKAIPKPKKIKYVIKRDTIIKLDTTIVKKRRK